MLSTLPTSIVRTLDTLAQALAAIAQTERDGSLATLEQSVLEALRAAAPGLLTGVIEMSHWTLGATAAHFTARCPRCQRRLSPHDWRRRTLQTRCGPIAVERPWYHCPSCQHGFSPTDTDLAVDARSRLSAGIEDWVVRLGATTTFAEAAELLAELTGVRVSAETVRQRTEARGEALEAADAAAAETVERTQTSAVPLDPIAGPIVVETDGVLVRYADGWREVKVGLFAGCENGQLVTPSYVAARQSATRFGRRLVAEGARRGCLEVVDWSGSWLRRQLAVLPTVVVLGDGAPWIWELADEQFGTRVEIVDFYHASEYVWKAAKALFGETSPETTEWAVARLHELKHEGPAPVLRALKTPPGASPEVRETLTISRRYLRTHASRMDYPAYQAAGYPIGSGGIESAAKHVVQLRFKRPGMRWSPAGAQHVLAVRCRLRSHRSLAA